MLDGLIGGGQHGTDSPLGFTDDAAAEVLLELMLDLTDYTG
jgi:hypothetical protein